MFMPFISSVALSVTFEAKGFRGINLRQLADLLQGLLGDDPGKR